jgi:hypothetical protein
VLVVAGRPELGPEVLAPGDSLRLTTAGELAGPGTVLVWGCAP